MLNPQTELYREQAKKQAQRKNQQDNPDPFYGLKYIAYCRAHLPPEDAFELEDFTDYAKQYICAKRNALWLDPIWDRYTEEDILAEYFTIRVFEDEQVKVEMENSFKFLSKKDEAFFEKMTKDYEDRKAKKLADSLPDKIADDFSK